MSQSTDINNVKCTATRFENGILLMDTPPLSARPLNLCLRRRFRCPVHSFHHPAGRYVAISLFLFPDFYGCAVYDFRQRCKSLRLVWYLQGVSGLPDNRCLMVSNNIRMTSGWYTATVDLFDPLQGLADQNTVVDCPPEMAWSDNTPALLFRLDPNENILDTTLRQRIDWIKLTKD